MKKILLVGDDKNILDVVKHILILFNFQVKTSTGLHVQDIVMHYQPNIILLEKGFAAKLNRERCGVLNQIHMHLPIILFSADVEQKDSLDFCHEDEVLQKAIDIKNLINALNLN